MSWRSMGVEGIGESNMTSYWEPCVILGNTLGISHSWGFCGRSGHCQYSLEYLFKPLSENLSILNSLKGLGSIATRALSLVGLFAHRAVPRLYGATIGARSLRKRTGSWGSGGMVTPLYSFSKKRCTPTNAKIFFEIYKRGMTKNDPHESKMLTKMSKITENASWIQKRVILRCTKSIRNTITKHKVRGQTKQYPLSLYELLIGILRVILSNTIRSGLTQTNVILRGVHLRCIKKAILAPTIGYEKAESPTR